MLSSSLCHPELTVFPNCDIPVTRIYTVFFAGNYGFCHILNLKTSNLFVAVGLSAFLLE